MKEIGSYQLIVILETCKYGHGICTYLNGGATGFNIKDQFTKGLTACSGGRTCVGALRFRVFQRAMLAG